MYTSTMDGTNEDMLSDSDNENVDSTTSDLSTPSTSSTTTFKEPNFDFSEWSPDAPAGLQFLCLVPILSGYEANYDQSVPSGKVKPSTKHRQHRLRQRRNAISVGRNLVCEKKLRQAASSNDCTTVLELLDSGVDPSCSDEKKRTPLHFAASQGNKQIVEALLDHGADPNKTDVLGNTPLHLAACTIASHISVVTLLLKAGTNLQAVDRCGRTPLTFAKSQLQILMRKKSQNSEEMKKDISEVIEMMHEYLQMSGMKSDAQQLDSLCEQLNNTKTIEEVNDLNTLLSDFTNMTLRKKSNMQS